MKILFTVLTLCASISLVACGGSGSSSSGGGADLNLNGMWRVHHHFNEGGDFIRTYTLTLVQTDNAVTGTDIIPDPGPDSPCDSSINSYSGEVSGNSFSGTVTSDIYTETFTVNGSSNYLEGGFTVTYPAGSCRGSYKGNMIITRIQVRSFGIYFAPA